MSTLRRPAPADASRDVPAHAEDPLAIITKNKGEDVRVTLGAYAGVQLVDVRTFMDLSDGVRRATKKGVSLKVDRLPELIEGLQMAAQEALKRGLLAVPHEQPRPWWDRD